MFAGFGTVLNIFGIAAGSALGTSFGNRIPVVTRKLVTEALGCVTILAAVDALRELWNPKFIGALPKGWSILTVLASLLLGAILGSWLGIESRLEKFGALLRQRFSKSHDGRFLEGFLTASLLFAIGPLATLGAISDGMGHGSQQLILKSTLDFITSIAFAATFGWGVILSVIPVGIYQGLWTLAGWALGNVMSEYQVGAMTCVGGVLLFCIGLRVLDIKQIAVGNLLPAIFIAPIIATLAHQFH